jgi:hypothetical protein
MHTSAYESCRIHHNGDFDGDIYITNKDSTSKPVGEKAEIAYTTEKLIAFFQAHRESKLKKVVLSNLNPEGEELEEDEQLIEILFSDIEKYYEDVLIDKIREEMNDMDCSLDKLEKISKVLFG